MAAADGPDPTSRPEPLRRSRRNRFVAGVAAGFAEGRNLDPTVVRVAFVLLALVGGFGLFLYLLAWAGLPGPLGEPSLVERLVDPAHRTRVLAFGLCAAAVASALASQLQVSRTYLFPAGLILLGVLLIVPAGTRPPRPPRTTSLPDGIEVPATTRRLPPPLDETDDAPGPPCTWAPPAGVTVTAGAPSAPRPFTRRGAVPVGDRAGRTRRRGRWQGWRGWHPDRVTLVTHLLVVGVIVFGGLAGTPSATLAGVSLLLVAAGLASRAWAGNPFPLLRLGVLVVLLTPMLGRIHFNPSEGIGQTAAHPTTVAALQPYRLAVGSLAVDLRDVAVPPGVPAAVTAHVSIGEVTVTVAPSTRVRVVAQADAGVVQVFDEAERAGIDRDPVTVTAGGTAGTPPELTVYVSVDAGRVEVRHG